MSFVNFIYKNQKYPLSLKLFSNYSDYLTEIDNSEAKKDFNISIINEFELDHMIPDEIVNEFIQYFNDEEININYNNIFSIKYLSRKFKVLNLTEKVDNYINDHFNSIIDDFFTIKASESFNCFCFYEIENFFINRISELINDERLLSFPINILHRILSKYTTIRNEQKNLIKAQNKKTPVKKRTSKKVANNKQNEIKGEILIDFVIKCIKKKGMEASNLFTTINIENNQLDYLFRKLNDECENIRIDFNVIQKQIIQHISMKNDQIQEMKENIEEMISANMEEISKVMENERNEIENRIQKMEIENQIEKKNHAEQIQNIKEENEQRLVEMRKEYKSGINLILKNHAEQIKNIKKENKRRFVEMKKECEENINSIEKNLEQQMKNLIVQFHSLIDQQVDIFSELKEEQKKYINETDARQNEFLGKTSFQLNNYEQSLKKIKDKITRSESKNFMVFNKMINNKNAQVKNIFDSMMYFADQFNRCSQSINIYDSFSISSYPFGLKEFILNSDIKQNEIQNITINFKTIENLFSSKSFSISKLIEYLRNKFDKITFEIHSSSQSFYDIFNAISEKKKELKQFENKIIIKIIYDEKRIRRIYEYEECVNSISINNQVKTINENAFADFTSLTDVFISSSVTSLEKGCFSGCSSLKQVTFDNNLNKYDLDNFSYHNKSMTNKSILSFGPNAFKGCISLENIEIPDSVESIKSYCFSGCSSLKQIKIPYTVTEICDYAFEGCSSLKQAPPKLALDEQ